MASAEYMKLLNCGTADEVYANVRRWISDLTDLEHLVRSTVLDIHAEIERLLKGVLIELLQPLVFEGYSRAQYQRHVKKLEDTVAGLNFATVHRLLKPALDAFVAPDLANIGAINELRNRIAHETDVKKIRYKGRSPFSDPDCLAQLFFEGWAVRKEIGHFCERRVLDPRARAVRHAEFYEENYDRLRGS